MIPSIDHWLGQENAIRRFKVALEASWSDGTRLPHMLFTGPPGVGKTLLGQLAAREIGGHAEERIAQVLNTPGTLNGFLMAGKDKGVLFIDEIHELLPTLQVRLYKTMEEQQLSLQTNSNKTVTMPLKNFTLVGATTDEFRILAPLRDRFKVVLPFTTYDVESLARITIQRAKHSSIDIEPAIGLEIARRSKGTPRLAIRLLESCHRYARSIGDDRVTMKHFMATVELDGLDALGLGSDEQRYLQALASRHGKPMRLFDLEANVGVHRRTIQDVIEPFLIRSGLVERNTQGRILTETGMRHLGLLPDLETVSEVTS